MSQPMMVNLVFDLTGTGGANDVCLVPYHGGSAVKNPAVNVYEHQLRNRLEDVFCDMGLPYALATITDARESMQRFNYGFGMPAKVSRDWAQHLASDKVGFTGKDVSDWVPMMTLPRQGKTIFILVPRGYKDYALNNFKLLVRMKSPEQGGKIAKYVGRLVSPHKKHARGEKLDLHGDVLTVRFSGQIFKFRLLSDTPFLAGGCQLSPRFLNTALGNYGQYRENGVLVGGRRWREGDTFRSTFACDALFNKNQGIVRSFRGGFDGVLSDNKLILGTEDVWFGLMDELHTGVARTNIQDAINGLQYKHFPRLADLAYNKLYQRCEDQTLMMSDYLGMDPEDGSDPFQTWAYTYAVQNGVDVSPYFGLAMRPYRQMAKQILDPTKARIEMPKAVSAYYMYDRWIVNDVCQYDPRGAKLKGRFVANPGLEYGKRTVFVRSPTASPVEWYWAWAAHIPVDVKHLYSPHLFEISHDCALDMYHAGGGADNDDLGRGIQDEEMVDTYMNQLPAYPPKAPRELIAEELESLTAAVSE